MIEFLFLGELPPLIKIQLAHFSRHGQAVLVCSVCISHLVEGSLEGRSRVGLHLASGNVCGAVHQEQREAAHRLQPMSTNKESSLSLLKTQEVISEQGFV